ncbi:MAG: DUF2238 domain-containing protein [Pirellulaceae bacterium]
MTDSATEEQSLLRKRGLVLANGCILIAALAGCIATGDYEFIFYLATLCLLIGIVVGLYRRVRIGDGVLWGLTAWAAMHMAGGLVSIPESWPHAGDSAVLYNAWIIPEFFKYDHLVHAFGFGTTTFLCWQSMCSAFGLKPHRTVATIGKLFLAASAACGLGAANEIVEYAATVLFPDTNVGGYVNTAHDLISNAAGSFIAAVIIRFRRVRQ